MKNMRRKFLTLAVTATVAASSLNGYAAAAEGTENQADPVKSATKGSAALSEENKTPDFWDMFWGFMGQANIATSGPEFARGSQQLSTASPSSDKAKLSVEGSAEAAALGSFGAFGDNRMVSRAVLILGGVAAVVGAVVAGAAVWMTHKR